MFSFDQYLAIDYGSTYLKGILFKKTFGKLTILRTEILPIVELQDTEGDPFEYNIVRFIQSFFPEENRFLLNLNPEQVFLREVTVPIASEKALQEILPFEMENLVPYPMEDLEVIGKTWKSTKESSDVICFNAHHKELERVLRPFSKGDMHLSALSVDSFTLSTLLFSEGEKEENPSISLQLDIGGKYSILNVVHGSTLRVTRLIPIGGENITEDLERILKIERSKAEEIKKSILWEAFEKEQSELQTFSFLDFTVKKDQLTSIHSSIRKVFDRLLIEIENTILSLADSERPSQLYISGGSSQFKGAREYLAESSGLVLSHYYNQSDPSFVVSHSLGKHFESKSRLDFLSTKFARGFRKSSFKWQAFKPHLILTSISFFILLLVFIIGVVLDKRKIEANKKILADKYKQGFGTEIQADENILSVATGKLKTEKKKTEIFRLFLSQASILDLIHEISDQLPGNDALPFVLDQFNFEGNEIQIYGRVNEFSEIGTIQAALEKSEKFTNVQVLNKRLITGVNKLKVSFKFKLDIVIPKEDI